ncbi:MAG TPA: HAD family hydrolase [Candidatus Krumholzibacteria bacterium]|nr:HAD family hydrolase [Candidatus Krumholzibacteria bacterium]
MRQARQDSLDVLLLSVHGLIRGHDLELGRDADTGGQTKYVVELARTLGAHPCVERVELVTRRVVDLQVSPDYAAPTEDLGDGARIVRIACGEEGYVPKEELWDALDSFCDRTLAYLRSRDRLPDVIHSHYADAGYVGARLARQLGLPLVHTGHSLGRVKRRRLLAAGIRRDELERRYRISRRIEAEEDTLGMADLVITSTRQEIEAQYGLYDHHVPDRMRVIPPGVDLDRFHGPDGSEPASAIARSLARFLDDPAKPVILALSRPDPRKNIITLIDAFGGSSRLQDLANLVIVAGNRDDIAEMDAGGRDVLTEILLAIDRHDLYGKVAYPKHHQADEVPVLYRLAALRGGVFVNPALTEPFGLTLLEAAASGLPVVATEDGGPRDIIENCRNGHLVDPLDAEGMAQALRRVLEDREHRRALALNGLEGVRRHYAWQSHAAAYVEAVAPLVEHTAVRPVPTPWSGQFRDRAVFTDLDKNLVGDPAALDAFITVMQRERRRAVFGIATGRRLDSALRLMRRLGIPRPDVLIASLGTDIYYGESLMRDLPWRDHVDHLWHPRTLRRLVDDLPGVQRQPASEQGEFKLSWYIDPALAPSYDDICRLLHQNGQSVNVTVSFGQFLDIIPVRASKGDALRWFAAQRDVPLHRVLTAGGSGADETMMRGDTLAVVAANRHHEELSSLAGSRDIFFATRPYAGGILEAIEHYDFFGACRVPVP